jgi:cytochrome c oxidase subunit III
MATFTSADTYPDYRLPFPEVRLRRARLGLGVGLLGIVMVFVSFTSAYIVRQGLPTLDPRTNTLVRDWSPMPLPTLLFFNTGLLLLSSVTMELARRQVRRDFPLTRADLLPRISQWHKRAFFWVAFTVVLGLSFLCGQWIVWRELAARGFYVATSPSSSFVYLLTGTHGVHLLGGVLALVAAGAVTLFRRQPESQVIVLDVTAWYWHFMALLWIYVLCLLEFA